MGVTAPLLHILGSAAHQKDTPESPFNASLQINTDIDNESTNGVFSA